MFWAKLKSIFQPRERLKRLAATFGLDGHRCTTPAHQRTAFTMALVGLAAKMAKADGVAVRVELDAFERWFHVPDDQLDAVRRVFDLAKRDVAGYAQYAHQINDLLSEDPELKRDVFECLFHVASADGVLHTAEEQFLKQIAASASPSTRTAPSAACSLSTPTTPIKYWDLITTSPTQP